MSALDYFGPLTIECSARQLKMVEAKLGKLRILSVSVIETMLDGVKMQISYPARREPTHPQAIALGRAVLERHDRRLTRDNARELEVELSEAVRQARETLPIVQEGSAA